MLIGSLVAISGGGLLWWNRHWVPTRGILNPCLHPTLPPALAEHPVVGDALEGLRADQIWDCHVHLLGIGDAYGDEVWVNPAMDSLWHPFRAAQKQMYLNASCPTEGRSLDEGYVHRLVTLLDGMPGARLMLLAFDYHHSAAGQPQPELSTYYVSNAYAQSVAARHDRFEWICSVHPYREDALEALRWSAERGARAVKWLPPAMGMNPDSERCDAFYEVMRELDLPLLTHGGDELAVEGEDHQHLGNPLLLRRALDHGVRVVVAHCASLGEGEDLRSRSGRVRSNFALFLEMMRDRAHEKLLFGEISATTQINRAGHSLVDLLQNEHLHERLLHGSDYPLAGILPLFSPSQLRSLGLIDESTAQTLFEVQRYNPPLFDLLLKRTLRWQGRGFPRGVFETASFFGKR